MVKYLFWACEEDAGIFETLDENEYQKFKRMSKYKKEEMDLNGIGAEPNKSESGQTDTTPAMNLWLDIDVE